MNIRNIKIALVGLSIVIILNFVIFIFYFHNQTISKSVSDWASFADYMNGTTSILISIMTLLVTLFIAYEISNLEEKRNAANIEYEKKKFKRELREKEYAEITENLNTIWFALINEDRKAASENIYVIRQRFVSFMQHKKHLFPGLNPIEFQNLDNTLTAIMALVKENLEVDNSKTIDLVAKFQKEVSLFHKRVQEYILSEYTLR
jgi:fumarate reductase subunit C